MSVWTSIRKLTSYLQAAAKDVIPYRPPARMISETLIEDLPLLRMSVVERMLADPQVAIGTLVRDGLLSALEVEPEEGDPAQIKWAIDQWEKIWHDHGDMLMRAKLAGHGGYEVKWIEKDGLWVVDGLREFHPRDVYALAANGEAVGLQLRRHSNEVHNLFAPRALWVTYRARYGRLYGDTYLRAAYLPWYKKWMQHGCEKQTTLYMLKCSVLGEIVWYPPDRIMKLPTGEVVSARDVVREVMENRMSFGIATLPILKDSKGEREIEYQPPTGIQGGNPFEWWADDLGRAIWKGMGILPEVIEATGTGAFSGRSVPFVGLLSLLYGEAKEIFNAVRRDVLIPGCWVNFGKPNFRLRPKPLTETYKDDMGGGEGEGGAGGGMGAGGQPTMRPNMMGNSAPQQVQFGEADPREIVLQFDEAAGKWITIGARPGGDGERHGGTPVLIRDGKIVSGPKSLKGRRIDALDKEPEPDPPKNPDLPKSRQPTHILDPKTGKMKKVKRKPEQSETGESRLKFAVRTAAEKYGLKEEVLKDAVEHVYAMKKEAISQREELKRQLREDTGITRADFARISNSGGDYTQIPRIDEIAQEAARLYPELGIGDPDDKNANLAANFWAVVSEGRIGPKGRAGPEAKYSDEIVEEAVDLVLKSAKTDQHAEWDDVQFAEGVDALYPRDKSGQPVDPSRLKSIVGLVASGKMNRDRVRAIYGDEVYFAIKDHLESKAAAAKAESSPDAQEKERLRLKSDMLEAKVRQLEARAAAPVEFSEDRPRDPRGRFLSSAAINARTDAAAAAIVADVKDRVMAVLRGVKKK